MWRSLASNMLTILAVLLFLGGGLILWGQSQYTTDGPLDTAICLRVDRGSNMTKVSQSLQDQGAVSSAMIFRLGADYSEKAHKLKAGNFLVESGASMEQIVDQITRGGASTCGTEIVYRIGVTRTTAQVRELDPATQSFVKLADFEPGAEDTPAAFAEKLADRDTRFRVAMAEGVTSAQVVNALNEIDILEGSAGQRPAEGTLAPDSYEITRGMTRAGLIAQMQEKQVLRVNAAWESRQPDLPLNSPAEMLVLASIIEKETGVPEERRQVASVFVNRLNRGMRLQTDPTVIYGITKGERVLGRGLRQSELRKATPWNTYVIEGLPPTPIANPGLASLEAAVNPDQTEYVFFVADGTGGHAFAATLEEHNRNVVKWREIEKQRQGN